MGLCAQDSRQVLASTGEQARHLVQGPREPWAQALGPSDQGVQPGQWEPLDCVFDNPVIIVFAVMISVCIAISLGKSVPTCVFYRET